MKFKYILEENYDELDAKEIYQKGIKDLNFDFEKGLDALIKKDKTGENIYFAGFLWKKFDFEKGLDALIKVDEIGKYICYAGRDWEQFDYKKGLAQLKKISPNEWHRIAKENWPLSGKAALDKISDELSKTPKRPDKKMKL